jgi:ATP-dependent helicase/nuclease subunit A
MSIHKSKGLEFPVVILAECGKGFNLEDLRAPILLNHKFGIAPKYINKDLKIEYKTTVKKAAEIIAQNEIISEEMRVLYVALTRPKEKLIIVGRQKDVSKKLEKKEKLISLYEEEKISPFITQGFRTYLDWIELVYKKEKNKSDLFEFNIVNEYDIVNTDNKEKEEIDYSKVLDELVNRLELDSDIKAKIDKEINWNYEFDYSGIVAKSSVSKIKEYLNADEESSINVDVFYSSEEEKIKSKELSKPLFIYDEKNVKISSAEKGTLTHLVLQKLDFSKKPTIDEIQLLVNDLVRREIITKAQAEAIDIEKIYNFTYSSLFNNLLEAKAVCKEIPFYTNIRAKDLYKDREFGDDLNEKILVQGIIDLFYIDKDDKLVLVDYKTDYMKNNSFEEKENLIKKYKNQLDLYRKALEESMGRKVEKVILYSIYLNEEIEINI